MKNVVVSFNMDYSTGRDEVVGVLKFIRDRTDWSIRILNRPELPALLRRDRAAGIDGLITSCALDADLLALLDKKSVPSVFLEMPRSRLTKGGSTVSLIRSDNRAVGRMGAEHFLSLGRFASYGFVKPDKSFGWADDRALSFKATLAKKNCRVRVLASDDDPTALRRWLCELPKPAAVMAATDKRAVDVLNACHAEKIVLPDQLVLLGVDNDALFCEHMRPTLTSIQLNCTEQGFLAAKELNRLMTARQPSRRIREIQVPPLKLIERESTRPMAPSVQLVERALAFIRANACTGIRVPDVAAHLGISRRLADLRFREVTGGTIAAEITRIRLTEVERLIAAGERSARRLAASCGFNNAKYLQNLFRKRYGATIRTWHPPGSAGAPISRRDRA